MVQEQDTCGIVSASDDASLILRGLRNFFINRRDTGFRELVISEETLSVLKGLDPVFRKKAVPDTFAKIQSDVAVSGVKHFFYEGSPHARVLFLYPISGMKMASADAFYASDQGQLFEKILSAMNLSRDRAFVTFFDPAETVRPIRGGTGPFNGWTGLVRRQINLIKPECVCALGEEAASVFLGNSVRVEDMRGRFENVETLNLMVTWHPERLLRDPSWKRDVWEDMKRIMAKAGL